MNGWPPIVSVPTRATPPLGATAKPTLPLAEPLLPDVTVSHGESLDADHAHPVSVVTPTVPVPPAAAIV